MPSNDPLPERPRVTVDVDAIDQSRQSVSGHTRQVRGTLADDRVRIERQRRLHRFGSGMEARGPAVPLLSCSLAEAVAIYRHLDCLFGDAVERSHEEEHNDA